MMSTSGRGNPDPITWPELLALAATPEEVVRIALDFFASLTPQEVARLPQECIFPHRFSTPEQVVDYAFMLVRHRVSADDDNTVVFRLANFFSHAARRVAELMSEAPPADAANGDGVGITPVLPRP